MGFLRIGDRAAGAIKSGGTTRRAAKMVIVDADHPDIESFVDWKVIEEQKVAAIVAGSKIYEKRLNAILEAVRVWDGREIDAFDPKKNEELKSAIVSAKADFVVNMRHGRGGEDGAMQGLLEVLGLPCGGSGVLASALAMDKIKSKLLWRQAGLPTPDFLALDANTDWAAAMAKLGPAVVKPVAGGSSLGVGIVADAEALERQFLAAAAFDSAVMAEAYIRGGEFSVGMLGDEPLPAVELRTQRKFFDYQAKYEDSETEYICPPEIPRASHDELLALAREAYRALGCRGLARVDLMRAGGGGFFLLEINTIPGMTGHSIIPMAASRLGRSYDDLMLQILQCEAEDLQP